MKNIFIIVFALFAASNIEAQVGIGTITPAEDAILELDNPNKALLLTRVTDLDVAIPNPVNGMIVYDELNACVRAFEANRWSDCLNGTEALDIGDFPSGFVNCGTYDPTEVVDVMNPDTDETWMDRNLGASQAATNSTDAESYGDLYQWGRFADGHQCRNSPTHNGEDDGYATIALPNEGNVWDGQFILTNSGTNDWLSPQNDDLWQGVNGINNPCPLGYRLPTSAEWEAERQSWSSNDAAGAFDSPLKLPVGGQRVKSTGSLSVVGGVGFYWSSTVNGTQSSYLTIYSTGSGAGMSSTNRAYGFSVRCIKD